MHSDKNSPLPTRATILEAITAEREHWLIPETTFTSYSEYRARTGEGAVHKARQMSPEAVLGEIQLSGLRGRGGAGFPTGTKWTTIKNHPCPTRFVVCNAAEGEPGTFKDRWLLRKNPYSLIEGMLIAAHVVGTRAMYIAIKASFARELARLRSAIQELGEAGLLQGYQLHVIEGPDEYLFGEEKALLEVISGNDPLPREAHNPPYETGLFPTGTSPNPALVHNVETFSHVPSIIRAGAASFRKLGTHDTPGTVIFTVSGDVKRPGIYELEAGITLRDLFFGVAGGPRDGRTFKAALSGVSSGVIPAAKFDTSADFGSLQRIGAGLGSAGFMVFDDRTSMPRVAQALARFLYVESCNQCSACKHGLRTASHALDELFDPAKAAPDALRRANLGAGSAPQGNRCFLPVEGSILIPSLVEGYAGEFAAQRENPAHVTEPVVVPKIVDFDERTGTFVFDERQPLKTPDWAYQEPARPPAPKRPEAMWVPKDPARAMAPVRRALRIALWLRWSAAARTRRWTRTGWANSPSSPGCANFLCV